MRIKNTLLISFIVLSFSLIGLGCSASGSSAIYDNAEFLDAYFYDASTGDNTLKGLESVVKAEQADCTKEVLTDWYFNFVEKHSECREHVIVYSEDPEKGCLSMGGVVYKDVDLEQEDDGSYSLCGIEGSIYYRPDYETKILFTRQAVMDASELEDLKSKVEAVIPEEYKKSDTFWIEVEGEVGSLKLIIGLTDPFFADIDCREIAVYLAREVKDLDLGVGNFIVQFFSSMGTSEDLLAIEYLSIQDPETIDRPDVISYSGGTVDVQF